MKRSELGFEPYKHPHYNTQRGIYLYIRRIGRLSLTHVTVDSRVSRATETEGPCAKVVTAVAAVQTEVGRAPSNSCHSGFTFLVVVVKVLVLWFAWCIIAKIVEAGQEIRTHVLLSHLE